MLRLYKLSKLICWATRSLGYYPLLITVRNTYSCATCGSGTLALAARPAYANITHYLLPTLKCDLDYFINIFLIDT